MSTPGYVTLEMGKLIHATRAEVSLSASILDYYATHADAFLAPKALPQSPGAVVETQPLGVEPWNFAYY